MNRTQFGNCGGNLYKLAEKAKADNSDDNNWNDSYHVPRKRVNIPLHLFQLYIMLSYNVKYGLVELTGCQ